MLAVAELRTDGDYTTLISFGIIALCVLVTIALSVALALAIRRCSRVHLGDTQLPDGTGGDVELQSQCGLWTVRTPGGRIPY